MITRIDLRTLTFGEPLYLWLLLIPGGLLAGWVWQVWRRRRDTRRSASERLVPLRERFALFGDSRFTRLVCGCRAGGHPFGRGARAFGDGGEPRRRVAAPRHEGEAEEQWKHQQPDHASPAPTPNLTQESLHRPPSRHPASERGAPRLKNVACGVGVQGRETDAFDQNGFA